jgi:hypothetical protein
MIDIYKNRSMRMYIPETWQRRGHRGDTCEAAEEGLVASGLAVVVAEASASVAYSSLSLSLSLSLYISVPTNN